MTIDFLKGNIKSFEQEIDDYNHTINLLYSNIEKYKKLLSFFEENEIEELNADEYIILKIQDMNLKKEQITQLVSIFKERQEFEKKANEKFKYRYKPYSIPDDPVFDEQPIMPSTQRQG